jgi:hypothetical protein
MPPTQVLPSDVIAAARRAALEAPTLPAGAVQMLRRLHCPSSPSPDPVTMGADAIAA